jgi:hypothetical protein
LSSKLSLLLNRPRTSLVPMKKKWVSFPSPNRHQPAADHFLFFRTFRFSLAFFRFRTDLSASRPPRVKLLLLSLLKKSLRILPKIPQMTKRCVTFSLFPYAFVKGTDTLSIVHRSLLLLLHPRNDQLKIQKLLLKRLRLPMPLLQLPKSTKQLLLFTLVDYRGTLTTNG